MYARPIAYLTQGTLVIKKPGEPAAPYESYFAERVAEQSRRDRTRRGWQQQSGVWNVMGEGSPYMPGSGMAYDNHTPVRIVSAGHGNGGPLFVLQTPHICGLFHHEFADDGERRLIHKQEFFPSHPAQHPEGDIALALRFADGSSCIATCDADGRRLSERTDGDAVDEEPSWAGGPGKRIVYQSAGIARDGRGGLGHLSPYRIEMLDLDEGKLTTLLDDDEADLLQPRLTADGALYYLRRPYQPQGDRTWWDDVKAAVMAPFYLAMGVFYFFDFMTKIFAGRSLTTAGGPKRPGPDQRYMVLWGRMIDVQRAEAKAGKATKSLVPKTWTLMRRAADGTTATLAEGVGAYDIDPEGRAIICDGRRLAVLDDTGAREAIAEDRLVERVIAC